MVYAFYSKLKFEIFRFRNRHKVKIGKRCMIQNTIFEGKNSIAAGTK